MGQSGKTRLLKKRSLIIIIIIIANPDDVRELRSKRILLNDVGSDEEIFKFFKEISIGLIQDASIYRKVRQEIEEHCRSKIRTWFLKYLQIF